ncbi:MAG: proprotein convertase P-domain-containing protein, partial [Phaeodactylibacter sp.]|nr:proprotein convertase P-domain-containing protein [Phaeodactylibacter sp.]
GAYSLNGTIICTGFLVNNARQDCRPYFMSANHCGITSGNAPTMLVYWNYQNNQCRQPNTPASGQPGNGSLATFNSGAIFRAAYASSDFALVELDDPVNPEANAYFAGWNAAEQTPADTLICVHHPNNQEKRISFSFTDAFPTDWGNDQPNPAGTHMIVPHWNVGTTEGGSSGSPLFDKNRRVVGQLHGGFAACSNNEWDTFGWIYSSWDGGGSSSTRLRDWLDPDNTGITQMNGRTVAQCGFSVDAGDPSVTICGTEDAVYQLEVSQGFTADVSLSLLDLPAGLTGTFSVNPVAPGGTTTLTIGNIGILSSGLYSFTLEATDGVESFATALSFEVFESLPNTVGLQFPFNGSIDVSGQPTFAWGVTTGAATYDIELALDTQFIDVVALVQDLAVAMYEDFILEGETKYFWRVRAKNACGLGDWSIPFSFTTMVIDCLNPMSSDVPVTIPSAGTPTVTSTLEFPNDGIISDVDVIGVNGVHTWVGDLTITITSPEGTEVILVDQICDYDANFDYSFDDDAPSANIPCPPTTGLAYQPVGSLSAFNGEDPEGTWTLSVTDNVDYDGGQLLGWGLQICTSPAVPAIEVFPFSQQTCDDETASYTISVNSGFTGPVTLSAIGLPGSGAEVFFTPNPAMPGDDVVVTVTNPGAELGTFGLTFSATDGTNTSNFSVSMEAFASPGPATPQMPADAQIDVALQPTLTWLPDPAAVNYTVLVALDPNFTNLVASSTTSNTSLGLSFELEYSTIYYWQVISQGAPCEDAVSAVFSFTTVEDTGSGVSTIDGQQVYVQPNPTRGPVQIAFERAIGEMIQLDLWTVDGRLLESHTLQPGLLAYALDLQQYADGVYLLQLKSAGEVLTQRLILQE